MKTFNIQNISQDLNKKISHKIDNKTKPQGSLGHLEKIAFKTVSVQQSLSPQLNNPHIIVFAADHGIAEEGVSKYPQEVTYQMVLNFLNGGAAINTFCRQHNINLIVVDAGVKGNFSDFPHVVNQKINEGTKNFLYHPAMSIQQCETAILKGSEIVNKIFKTNCNIIGFGEMGIANTSSAAAIMHLITGISLQACIGRGTGIDNEQLNHKIKIIKEAVINRRKDIDIMKINIPLPLVYLSVFGGFEIAQMVGAMLQAAENKMIILIDGFITSSSLLIAYSLNAAVLDYCIFTHQSNEAGHQKMLNYLNVEPILKLDLRLGEGTGCALAYPLIQSSVNFFNEMASFEEASVSQNN